MALPSIDGDNYQVRLIWDLHSQRCYNVLNFHGRGVSDLLDNLVTPILECVKDNLLPVLSTEVTLIGGDVKNISGTTAQEGEIVLTADNSGEVGTDSLPSFNSASVKLKTSHPGRTGRGRMALLGIPESLSNDSAADAAFLAGAVAFLACMIAAYVNSDPLATPFFHWSVRSRKDNALYHIVTATPQEILGTQRSRMRARS